MFKSEKKDVITFTLGMSKQQSKKLYDSFSQQNPYHLELYYQQRMYRSLQQIIGDYTYDHLESMITLDGSGKTEHIVRYGFITFTDMTAAIIFKLEYGDYILSDREW